MKTTTKVAGFTCIPVRELNPTAEFAMTAFLV
jgi:hypothetical protein